MEVEPLQNLIVSYLTIKAIYVGEFINDLREGKGILYRMNEY